MANNNRLTETYESLPKIAKIIIQLILGAVVGGIYRILRFVETKKTSSLIFGILALIPPISVVAWICDLFTEITSDRITLFVE